MEHIGLDLHKQSSQFCILTEDRKLLELRIRTEHGRFVELLGKRPKAKVLLEASTESEWVARCIEEIGHEVIVADPNFAPMYATRNRKIKTDKRDARALCDACRLGAYRPAHRSSDNSRELRAQVMVRDALVKTRTRYISLIRSILRREGHRVARCGAPVFVNHIELLELPENLRDEVEPLLKVMKVINEQVQQSTEQLQEQAQENEVTERLCTVPGVGAVTASTYLAVIDDINRFESASNVSSYVGMVPKERSSSEKRILGRITKAGNSHLRWLLVEAAWSIVTHPRPETEYLRTWYNRIALRRGKQIAAVALARKLAGILYAIWRDGTEFRPQQIRHQEVKN